MHMNGGTTAPPWQESNDQNGKMFAVPTQLNENNEIIIKGRMTDNRLHIGLRPDSSQYNIVCQLDVTNESQERDIIEIKNVQNGNVNFLNDTNLASEFFQDTHFNIRFLIKAKAISIMVGESYLESIPLLHSIDNIRFISVVGEVQELSFIFG